ncbi:hypothetical protein [Burkholderia ubonensis]|uniref:hypothetical protein n=1 Tax=Burkholderia ubonensis TaxID=101571 RepID=UPI00114CA728|nr:hypothetical protein [Burkholderia ubonensis]MDY7792623.1 hypothetical protein [Burkholderia ubonensis]
MAAIDASGAVPHALTLVKLCGVEAQAANDISELVDASSSSSDDALQRAPRSGGWPSRKAFDVSDPRSGKVGPDPMP